MSLKSGHPLAHYEILELIGKGGMGEVYRARDGKLGRDVAIKVLPDEFADNDERLARFKREAKVLASLNHPNIASIYGLEQLEARTSSCSSSSMVRCSRSASPGVPFRSLKHSRSPRRSR